MLNESIGIGILNPFSLSGDIAPCAEPVKHSRERYKKVKKPEYFIEGLQAGR
jgi:hypothetical protein